VDLKVIWEMSVKSEPMRTIKIRAWYAFMVHHID